MAVCSSAACLNGFNWSQKSNLILSTYSSLCAKENRLDDEF